MDGAYVTAFAALAGSSIGGFTYFAASWLTQRVQVTAQQTAHEVSRREELYKDFIEEASNGYADAYEKSEVDVGKVLRLYALVSRMRVLSSPPVVERADAVMRLILTTYQTPNRSIRESVTHTNGINPTELDPLRDFSDACREERRVAYGVTLR